MSSPTSQETHNSTLESEPNHEPTGATTPAGTEGAAAEKSSSEDNSQVKKDFAVPEGHEVRGEGGGKEVEEAICGFRLFWKDHRFKDIIVLEEWQNCVEECLEKADDDDEEEAVKEINRAYVQREVVKSFNITTVLKGCVRAHPDYCGPLLQAEKAARREEEEEAARKRLGSVTAWILD